MSRERSALPRPPDAVIETNVGPAGERGTVRAHFNEPNPWVAGAPATVTDDYGRRWLTRLRSAPWKLADGTEVVLIEGIAGGYLRSRVALGEDLGLPLFSRRHEVKLRPGEVLDTRGGRP